MRLISCMHEITNVRLITRFYGSEGEVLVVDAMLHDEFDFIYQGSFEDITHDIWKQTTIADVEVF